MIDIYSNFGQIGDLLKQQPEIIRARHGRPPQIAITCLPQLNTMLWGLEKQKLVVLGARPGHGKSVFLLQLAYDFAVHGHLVHFYSFEMTKEVCAARLFSNRCKVDNYLMKTGKHAETEHLASHQERQAKCFAEAENANLFIFQSIGKSLPQLTEIYTRVKPWPGIIIIDYGNLVEQEQYKSRKTVYDDYIKGLRAIAVEQNVCVIMGAQIGRNVQQKGGGTRPPELEDFKETGVLEEQADQAILLFWPWYADEKKNFNDYSIRIAKNRDGRTGYIPGLFYPEYSLIQENTAAIEQAKKEKAEKNGQTRERYP